VDIRLVERNIPAEGRLACRAGAKHRREEAGPPAHHAGARAYVKLCVIKHDRLGHVEEDHSAYGSELELCPSG